MSKKQFSVIVECRVRKLVTCEAKSADEITDKTLWELAVDERELEQMDWEIYSIKADQ